MDTQDQKDPVVETSGAQAAPDMTAQSDAAPAPAPVATAQEDVAAVEPAPIKLIPRDQADNAVMDQNPMDEKPFKDLNKKLPVVAMPPETQERIQQVIDQITSLNLEKDPKAVRWLNVLQLSLNNLYDQDALGEAAARPDADWRQFIESESGRLGMGAVKIAAKEGEKLTGERAVQQVRALMGRGTPRQVMLPHSGFWVSVRAPGDSYYIDLMRTLAEDKIQLGRETTGVAFSNLNSFFAGTIANFVFGMVYDTTLKAGMENLGDKMLVTDLPSFVLGGAAAIWPNGFNYSRALLTNAAEQTPTRTGAVSIPKMQWFDNRSFTEWQRSHLAQRYGKNVTDEDLEKYRKEFTRGQPRMVPLNESVQIELKVPTVNEYLNSGQRWINNIIAMVDKSFALPPTDDARNDFINQHGKASDMRQFGHWIKAVHVNGVIYDSTEDQDVIDALLDDMAADEEASEVYFREVKKYINDVTVCLVAVPVEPGEPVDDKVMNPNYPHLLPIDVFHTFFTLLVQRVEQIRAR